MRGQPLTKDEIYSIIRDIVDHNLSELEIAGITYGGHPVGHAVGPALEAREALLASGARDQPA